MKADQKYRNLASIQATSKVICLSELADAATEDHFAPYYWPSAADPDSPGGYAFRHAATFDDAKNETKDLELRRHLEGFNNLYCDGHAKWHKWTQVWFQNTAVTPNVLEGNFELPPEFRLPTDGISH